MSFLKKLFGGGSAPAAPKAAATIEIDGYTVTATPAAEGGQYRLTGTIAKEIDGARKEHLLVRADLFASEQECVDATFRKAKMVIHEQGDRMFR
jgi:hypothetical protein